MTELVVNVKQGLLQGKTVTNLLGGSYFSFKKIPYARPPVGHLRFQDPQPPESWTGTRDASKDAPICAQKGSIFPFRGEDDCLYLNVATKSLTGSRPVMVWIHGGGFMVGDGGGSLEGPDYFMTTEIVYVSMNYRLGILGFLNLDHEVAPGNAGLKDQVAALRWVQENISQFGGDPNNVTIFGGSAGGASVHYQLLSPLSKGLFKKAIIQSGAASNPWAYSPNNVELAHTLVAALGKETKNPTEIVDFLRTIPVRKLVETVETIRHPNNIADWAALFGPSTDDKSQVPFLPRPVKEMLAEGFDVPVLIGYSSHEGSLFTAAHTDDYYSKIDQDFTIALPHDLKDLPSSKKSEIRKLYFHDKRINAQTAEEVVQFYGDLYFVYQIHETLIAQAKKKTPTYLYKCFYESPDSFSRKVLQYKFRGAGHGDDLKYLFFSKLFDKIFKMTPGSVEQTISDRFIKMWTNFARTGDPTPALDTLIPVKWEPITSITKNYLAIDESLSMGINPDEEIMTSLKLILDN